MNEILRGTFLLTLFSLGMVVLIVIWLLIVTRRRHWWLRYMAAEERFYLKIGLPKRFAA
jgi:hypothetical protein